MDEVERKLIIQNAYYLLHHFDEISSILSYLDEIGEAYTIKITWPTTILS